MSEIYIKIRFPLKVSEPKKRVGVVVGLIATGGRNGNGIMLIQNISCWTFMKDYYVSHLQHVAFVPMENELEYFQPYEQTTNSRFNIILGYYKI